MSDQPIDDYHKLLNIIKGVDADDLSKFVVLTVDKNTRTLRINNWVWDPDLTPDPDWVRMKQPILEFSGDLTVTMGDVEKLLAGVYFPETRYDYDADDNCIYKGEHTTLNVSEDDTEWRITKYDYTSGNNVHKRKRVTSWTLKADGW
jgi:hypothetical protein